MELLLVVQVAIKTLLVRLKVNCLLHPLQKNKISDLTDVNWNANALQKAKDYQSQQSMSSSAIYNQLTSSYGERFTPAQAKCAINHLND